MQRSSAYLLGLFVCLAAAGCLRGPAQVRLVESKPVLVAAVLDDVYQKQATLVPAPLQDAIEAELVARNLVPERADSAAYLPGFANLRDTGRRIAELSALAKPGEPVLLIETQARFYSQISGRYRWNVYVKLTLSDPASKAEMSDELSPPALLLYDHEREAEALLSVQGDIAKRVAILIDNFFGAGASAGSAPSAKAKVVKDDVIYFVMVDRFANGEPKNDLPTVDVKDPQAWHGGDLAGVMSKIDYLHDLGVRTVWLSPVFACQTTPFMGHGAFHGYWTTDLNQVAPQFGSEDELKALAAALHQRGMRLVLDWVVNHTGYEAPLYKERPTWFHAAKTITDWNDPTDLEQSQVHGLPDLAQENDEVYGYLLGAARSWVKKVGVDGFRLDAVKHVPMGFWQRMNADLSAEAPGLMLLGELYDGKPSVVATAQERAGFSDMFDFPVSFALREVMCGDKSPGELGAVLWGDRFYADPNRLVTFLDNHDLPRITSVCGDDLARVRQALLVQLSLRGKVGLTYGTESGLRGQGEPDNRGDMVFAPEAEQAAAVRAMLQARAQSPALQTGNTRILGYADDVLTIGRFTADQVALLWVSGKGFAGKTVAIPTELWAQGQKARDAQNGLGLEAPEVTLGPSQAKLVLLDAATKGAFSAMVQPSLASRTVKVTASGVTLGANESLRLVGSGPELGDWSPEGAPALGADLQAELTLPVGGLWAYKLVVWAPGAAPRWESGENRYLYLAAAAAPVELALAWREG